ncbi:MAG: YlmC/YmxH family sporulation protein [Clostridia bacterium]|nr:YlmC/YmxH family sporulation protein [Clostridia bacterium]
MFKASDLRVKDVIDVEEGRRLGFIYDLEVDVEAGRVTALVLPGAARFFGLLGRERDIVVPWEDIVKIGEDVILVHPGRARGRRGE